MKKGQCNECGIKLNHHHLTHCSNQCLFLKLHKTKSISGHPIEKWDEGELWV